MNKKPRSDQPDVTAPHPERERVEDAAKITGVSRVQDWLLDFVFGGTFPSRTDPSDQEEGRALLRLARLPNIATDPHTTLDLLLKEAKSGWEEENGRRSRIESKATALLALVGVTTTVATGLLFSAIKGEGLDDHGVQLALRTVLLATVVVGVAYFGAAAFSALQAHRAAKYWIPSLSDFKRAESLDDLRRQMAERYLRHSFLNMPGTNYKAEWVGMAQSLVLRGILAFGLAALIACVKALAVGPHVQMATSSAGGNASTLQCARCPEPSISPTKTKFILHESKRVGPFRDGRAEPLDDINLITDLKDFVDHNCSKCTLLLLLGQADIRRLGPETKKHFQSNKDLADRRAEYVAAKLGEIYKTRPDCHPQSIARMQSGPYHIEANDQPSSLAEDRQVILYRSLDDP
jgi:hypothetical protein